MIIFRPQRGTLVESMRAAEEFGSLAKMKKHIVDEANHHGKDNLSIDDIIISETNGRDSRCGWWDSSCVCVKRYGKEIYDSPQCIGVCATLYSSYNRQYWESMEIAG
jgi:hypothetical protein